MQTHLLCCRVESVPEPLGYLISRLIHITTEVLIKRMQISPYYYMFLFSLNSLFCRDLVEGSGVELNLRDCWDSTPL